jgi:universal stress protein E
MTPARLRRVLAAVAPGAPLAAPGLAEAVIESALAIAEVWSAELYVVHSWAASWEMVMRSHLPADQVEAYLQDCRVNAAHGLRRFLAPYGDRLDGRRVELVKGSPEAVIEEAVARLRVDLVVLGTTARRGIPALVIGNTAEKLAGRLEADLLVVKAPSFVSPRRPRLPAAVVL